MSDSKVVVENDDFVAGGVLTYQEGDIIEVELHEYDRYQLGMPVKVVVYASTGVYTIDSSVVGIGQNVIYVLNPPEKQRETLKKREYPRVEWQTEGRILWIRPVPTGEVTTLDEPTVFHIQNISLNGIGFSIQQNGLVLNRLAHLGVSFQPGRDMECEIEIVRLQKRGNVHFYGAQIVKMGEGAGVSLRSFVLRLQIEHRHEARKRAFQEKLQAEA